MRSVYGFVRRSPPFMVRFWEEIFVFTFFCLDFVIEGSSGGKLLRLAIDFCTSGVSPLMDGDESNLF